MFRGRSEGVAAALYSYIAQDGDALYVGLDPRPNVNPLGCTRHVRQDTIRETMVAKVIKELSSSSLFSSHLTRHSCIPRRPRVSFQATHGY